MSQELFIHAQGMFDTPDKWEAYLELINQKDKIFNSWLGRLKPLMHKKFIEQNHVAGWECKQNYVCDMRWYLSEFGEQSISLYWGWYKQISLRFLPEMHDVAKIRELMQTEEFSRIYSAFDRVEGSLGNDYIAYENGNFQFNSPFDNNFNEWQLSWYAGNKSNELVDQIARKIDRFRKDPEITNLIAELNRQTKK